MAEPILQDQGAADDQVKKPQTPTLKQPQTPGLPLTGLSAQTPQTPPLNPQTPAIQNSPDPLAFNTSANTGSVATPNTVQPPQYTGPAGAADISQTKYAQDFQNAPPALESLTPEELHQYWVGQFAKAGQSGLANTGYTPKPGEAYDPLASLNATKDAYAQNQSAIDAITQRVRQGDAANVAKQNAAAQAFADDNNRAAFGQTATGLNSQQGYAGSGNDYADPNAYDEWVKRRDANPGGAVLPGIANPKDQNHSLPDLGTIVQTGTQDKPTDQGGVVTQNPPTPGLPVPQTPGQTNSGTVTPPNAATADAGGDTGSSFSKGVNLSNIDPNNSLLGKQIAPDNNVDRVKTFQDALNSTIQNVINPAYGEDAKQLNRFNFGAGRGVSGQARTGQGDLAAQRDRQIADLAAQGLSGATTGSIDDMYRNLGIAQQQQGFQRDLSNDAYNQAFNNTQLEDALTNSAFGRAAAQQSAGEANNPANIALILSQIFGQQSGDAGKAAAGLFGQIGQKNGNNGGGLDIGSILSSIFGGGGGGGGGGNTAAIDNILKQGLPGISVTPGGGY